MSYDWYFELTRERLTEIYPKSFVDHFMPFRQDRFFFNDTFVINDQELQQMGLHTGGGYQIYEVDEDLLFFRNESQPKKDKIRVIQSSHSTDYQEDLINEAGAVGSNCWTVHGNHTKSGKAYLSCDPHLNKQMQPMFYLSAARWNTSDGSSEGGFISGNSVVGTPMYIYARTKGFAWGCTAANPDLTDLYVE
jgi:acyl-homoserine lactone acylase PvdQ